MSNESILVVDDNPAILSSIQTLLKRWRFKTSLATHSREALEMFQKVKPGLVLIDIFLPGVNGIHTLEKMKEMNRHFSPIVMTGNPAQEFILRGLKVGAADILVKPFTASQLKTSLDHALNVKRKWSQHIAQNQCIAKMIRSKTEQLTLMKKELFHLRKMATVGELTGGLVHEINQPLGSLMLNCQEFILRTEEAPQLDSAEMKPLLEEMLDQMDLIAKIVRNMRSFSRASENQAPEMLELNTLLHSTVNLIGNQLTKHNIEMQFSLAKELPSISGHPIRLQQVIMNLLSNARDALAGKESSPRTITLSTELLHLETGHKEIRITVKDNGSGIPESIKDKIFLPLFTTKDRDHGTGLGLPISKEIIEEMGGRIEFESSTHVGTSFFVILPIPEQNEIQIKMAA